MIVRAAAITAALALAACAGTQREDAAAPSPQRLCQELALQRAAAQRASFALDFAEAEGRMRTVLARLDAAGAAPPCSTALSRPSALAELGLTLSGQRQFRLADAAFAEARDALAATPGDDPAAEADRALVAGRIGVLEAQHALNQRDFAVARDRSATALAALGAIAETARPDVDDLFEIDDADRERRLAGVSGYFAQSAALSRTGDPDAARGAIVNALSIAETLPGATGALRSRVLAERSLVEFEAGRPELALAYAREAAEQLEQELPGTPLTARTRMIEGTALARLGRTEEAFAAFDRAFLAYGETAAALQYESIWPFIRLSLASRDAGLIDEQAMAAGVFRAAQLVRSATAASDIAQGAALLEAGTGEAAEAVRAWRAAQEELLLLTTALSRRDLDALEREALNRRFAEASTREAAARGRRDRVAPEYRRAIETPVALTELQATLRPGEALLQILVGTPRSTLILVTPERVAVETTLIDRAFAEGVTQILRDPMQPGPDGRYVAFPAGVAHQVHDLLLGALAADVAAADRVFVASTGALQALPLEMLVTRDPADAGGRLAAGDYGGVAWLGAETEFSYLPSPRNLVDLRGATGGSAASRPLIGFGDFRPGADPAAGVAPRRREACAPEVAMLRRLPALPGTATELAGIEAAFGGTAQTFAGEAFTEETVKRMSAERALRDFRVVHLATHGLLWSTVDCFDPALTATIQPGGSEDGLIESSEIRALDLDAQLVVLSACQSTDPLVADAGENLSGLARAFFTSGARSVMASHWVVDDVRTAALMAAFYRRLAADPTLAFASALAQAQTELRADPATSHPVFWAPFVVLGDGTLSLGAS